VGGGHQGQGAQPRKKKPAFFNGGKGKPPKSPITERAISLGFANWDSGRAKTPTQSHPKRQKRLKIKQKREIKQRKGI